MKLSTVAIIGLVAAVRGMVPGSVHISARENLIPDCSSITSGELSWKRTVTGGSLERPNEKTLYWSAKLTSKDHPEEGYVMIWGAWTKRVPAPNTREPAQAALVNRFSRAVFACFPAQQANTFSCWKVEKGKSCRVRDVYITLKQAVVIYNT